MHADAKLHPHVHSCTPGYGPLSPFLVPRFHTNSMCYRARPVGIPSVHVPELVLTVSNHSVFRESMLCSHDLDLPEPRPCTMDVVCAPRVKITCIWDPVTMLALCFLGKNFAPPVGHPFCFRQRMNSRHASPRIMQLCSPGSPSTLRGPRLVWDAQIRCFSVAPWKSCQVRVITV